MGGQVEADVPIIMHGAVELAVTDLAEVEGAPVVQLLAFGVVTYLGTRVSSPVARARVKTAKAPRGLQDEGHRNRGAGSVRSAPAGARVVATLF